MKNHHAGGNTPTYPEIATATLVGQEDTGDTLRYTFSRAIGSKGWSRRAELCLVAIFSGAREKVSR